MSNDWASAIPWSFALIGFVLSLCAGHMMRGPKGCGGVIAAGFLAFILGLLLTVASAWVHSLCVDMHRCANHGDGNIGYWFHALFAVPVYWIAMAAFTSSDE